MLSEDIKDMTLTSESQRHEILKAWNMTNMRSSQKKSLLSGMRLSKAGITATRTCF